jgi:hypothetical protein
LRAKQRIALALGCCVACSAHAQELSLGSGLHYSSGTYGGSSKTTIVSVPVTARFEDEAWTLRLTVPFVRITGPSGVIPGLGQIGTQGARQSNSGLGDIVAAATYAAYFDGEARAGFDLTAKLKLGTADRDRGLGTGEHDLAFFAEPFAPLGRWTLFGALGYHMLGSSPSVPLHDVWSASLGLSRRIERGDSIGLSLDTRQPAGPSSAQRELMAFWIARLQRWKLQGYVLAGFAHGSPDRGAGLTLQHPF